MYFFYLDKDKDNANQMYLDKDKDEYFFYIDKKRYNFF